ncbi:MAG: NAD(P)H-hydrate dehydratase [Clostridia bacterium]|nr:NAD(P)H-hydrate dehydratase [Clostridia bacterium]
MKKTTVITAEWVNKQFLPRESDSHKGTYGQLLTVCGSYGMAGAALLCLRGALRSGVGLVRAAVPRSVYPLVAAAQPEAVFLPLAETEQGQFSAAAAEPLMQAVNAASAVVLGCGLGRGEDVDRVIAALLSCRCPLILDADGINGITPHILTGERVSAPRILTPHPGELAQLLDIPTDRLQRHREEIAVRFVRDHNVTLVLKGHGTLVAAPDRPLLVNATGNPGMATGGSGDVLAGIIGGLVAQGMPPYEAAACGVYIHGAAGDRAAARLSMHSMLPSDIIEELGTLFLQFEK